MPAVSDPALPLSFLFADAAGGRKTAIDRTVDPPSDRIRFRDQLGSEIGSQRDRASRTSAEPASSRREESIADRSTTRSSKQSTESATPADRSERTGKAPGPNAERSQSLSETEPTQPAKSERVDETADSDPVEATEPIETSAASETDASQPIAESEPASIAPAELPDDEVFALLSNAGKESSESGTDNQAVTKAESPQADSGLRPPRGFAPQSHSQPLAETATANSEQQSLLVPPRGFADSSTKAISATDKPDASAQAAPAAPVIVAPLTNPNPNSNAGDKVTGQKSPADATALPLAPGSGDAASFSNGSPNGDASADSNSKENSRGDSSEQRSNQNATVNAVLSPNGQVTGTPPNVAITSEANIDAASRPVAATEPTSDDIGRRSDAPATALATADQPAPAKTVSPAQSRAAQAEALVERVADTIQRSSNDSRPIRIRLTPPELGALRVEVSRHEGGVAVRLDAESAVAARTLSENAAKIRDTLSQQGFTVDRIEIVRSEESGESRSGQRDGDRQQSDRGQDDRSYSHDEQRRDDSDPRNSGNSDEDNSSDSGETERETVATASEDGVRSKGPIAAGGDVDIEV
ncbi:flagellar hook-length control protein FliK [Stratiformator vulcanicus]|uniref:flagellar hook-length control protein FliK n=1 Tax=Stratiformator vulcanicus TaxID=2527980 RepID=UPI0028779903|nr:flagellar hook-length control protein FliK [Stratiformator vulcanicus]